MEGGGIWSDLVLVVTESYGWMKDVREREIKSDSYLGLSFQVDGEHSGAGTRGEQKFCSGLGVSMLIMLTIRK